MLVVMWKFAIEASLNIYMYNRKSLNVVTLQQGFSGPNRYHSLVNEKLSAMNELPLLELLTREIP